jgi:hypothetical protein
VEVGHGGVLDDGVWWRALGAELVVVEVVTVFHEGVGKVECLGELGLEKAMGRRHSCTTSMRDGHTGSREGAFIATGEENADARRGRSYRAARTIP